MAAETQARGPVNALYSGLGRGSARAAQLQYFFHLEKILSCLANHTAIMLCKAKSTVFKTPSILLIPPLILLLILLLIPLLMLLLPPLILLLIPLLLLRERGLTPARFAWRIRQPLCWGGLAGSGLARVAVAGGRRPGAGWPCYRPV